MLDWLGRVVSVVVAVKLSRLKLAHAQALVAQAGRPLGQPQEDEDVAYLQDLIDALCDLSQRDGLTGLANRRQFRSVIEQELDRVARSGEMALLLMVDIDFFKRVNDTHGHVTGDRVIRNVARCVQECVRPMDTVARYGGEEFAVILPNCQATYGHAVAERIRRRVQAQATPLDDGQTLQVTVSCGGAFAPLWVRSDADAWIERADAQLYQAKHEGRNRVCIEPLAQSVVSAEEKSLLFGILPPPDDAGGDPHPEPAGHHET